MMKRFEYGKGKEMRDFVLGERRGDRGLTRAGMR